MLAVTDCTGARVCFTLAKCQAQKLEIHKKHFKILNFKLKVRAENYCLL